MAHRNLAATFLMLLFALATGCASSRPPAVVVADVRIAESTAEALTLEYDLDLTNPNREALELIAFEYGVDVDGRDAYAGRWSAEATLSPNATKRLVIPAVIPFDRAGWDLPPATATYRLSGTLLYVAPGRLAETLLDTGVRRPKVRFRDVRDVP